MLNGIRSKLTYANVMATVAVFLALGGGIAWALANNSVRSKHIKDGQVKSGDLNDTVEPQGFTYTAATGDDVPEDILDAGGYTITTACENVSGRPSIELFIAFPEDGRLTGLGVIDPGAGPPEPTSGPGVEIFADTPFDGGALTAEVSDTATLGSTFSYVGQQEAATINLHALADDDDDVCRMNGMLIPGLMPPQ